MIRAPYDKKEKDNQTKLYTHIFRNCKRIVNQLNLKDQKIERTEEIESNVRWAIAACFKKKEMSCSERGALGLLKIKETILNNEWDLWWEKGRQQNIKVSKLNPSLPASYFKKEAESSFLLEVALPALKR